LLQQVNSSSSTVAAYTYNARNQILTTAIGSGLFTATRGYDAAARLTGISNGTLDSTGYTLSADGRRTGISRNGSAESYGYDNARQVTSANYTGLSTTQSWTYDANGNRITAVNNSVTTNYNANSVNEYLTISGGGFQPPSPTYDENGNALILPLPNSTALTFTWDINNQQSTALNAAGDSAAYQYDALGRRTKRTETIASVTTETYFFTNGWNVELEHDGTQYTKRMTWGLDLSGSLQGQGAGGVGGLVSVTQLPVTSGTATTYFPTYDGNGNITAWIDAAGTIVATQRYDAFGNIIQQTGTPPSNYGFSTKPQEKVTGLLYYGLRYYEPITGRWPSRDPLSDRSYLLGRWNELFGVDKSKRLEQLVYSGLSNIHDTDNAINQEIKYIKAAEKNFLMYADNNAINQTDYLGLLALVPIYFDMMVGFSVSYGISGCACVCMVSGSTKHYFADPIRSAILASKKLALALQYNAACMTHGPHTHHTRTLCELLGDANEEYGPTLVP
jgi:RHS repeat-associated protein